MLDTGKACIERILPSLGLRPTIIEKNHTKQTLSTMLDAHSSKGMDGMHFHQEVSERFLGGKRF